jgi:hypothetical protein
MEERAPRFATRLVTFLPRRSSSKTELGASTFINHSNRRAYIQVNRGMQSAVPIPDKAESLRRKAFSERRPKEL